MNKKENGITLVAMIITVIIMLILAGVTLSIIIGPDGIIGATTKATKQQELAQQKEQKDLNELYSEMKIATNDNAQITVNIQDLKEIIDKQVEEKIKELNLEKNAIGINERSILMTATNYGLSINETYTLNKFDIIKGEEFDNYFTFDENSGDLICNVNGWYNIDLELRCDDSTGLWTRGLLKTYINDVEFAKASCFAVRDGEQDDNSSATIFLYKNDKVKIEKTLKNLNAKSSAVATVRIFKL